MKALCISRNQRELIRVQITSPLVVIGRSPSCDIVLRAAGIRSVHFLLEWAGVGEFDINQGFFTVFDISHQGEMGEDKAHAEGFGEGLVIGDEGAALHDFLFTFVEDNLLETHLKGGILKDDLEKTHERHITRTSQAQVQAPGQGQGQERADILEVVCVRYDFDAVSQVRHIHIPKNVPLRPLPEIPKLGTQWSATGLQVGLKDVSGAKIFNKGEALASTTTGFTLTKGDLIQVRWKLHDYYFRLVPAIEVPKPAYSFFRDPLVISIFLATTIFVGLIKLIEKIDLPKPQVVVAPPRIAKVEISELAPPVLPTLAPPPPPPTQAPPPPPINPKAEDKLQTVKIETKAPPAAAKFKSIEVKKPESGLNSPAIKTNVNSVGLLGALKKNTADSNTVKAENVFNDSMVSNTASGAGAKFTVKQPPTGSLGARTEIKSGDDLSGASTTLQVNDALNAQSAGSIAVQGGGSFSIGYAEAGRTGARTAPEGDQNVEGGLDKDSVLKALRAHGNEIRTCYERNLVAKPNLSGRVVYQWNILGNGGVTNLKLKKSDVAFQKLEDCVGDVISSIRFPQAPNGKSTTVIFPFVFAPPTKKARG